MFPNREMDVLIALAGRTGGRPLPPRGQERRYRFGPGFFRSVFPRTSFFLRDTVSAHPFDTEDQSLFERMAGLTQTYGWEEGLQKVLEECPVKQSRDLFWRKLHARHSGWIILLGPPRREAVFVMDRGWGAVAILLSRYYKRVYLWSEDETVWTCQKNRIEWLGIDNIEPLQEEYPFPLADHSCDAAVIYPLAKSGSLDDRLLQEIKRIVRPSGCCCIGFENPYGHRYLRALVGGKGSSDGSGCVSRHDVQKQLSPHFRTNQFYPFEPDLYHPRQILAPAGGDALWGKSFSSVKSLVKEKLWNYVGPAYGVVSSNGSRISLLETVLNEVASRLDKKRPLTLRRLLIGKPVALLLFVGETGGPAELLIRIPLDDFTLGRHRRHHENLQELVQLVPLPVKTPQPLFSGEAAGLSFFVEELISGAMPEKPSEPITQQAAAFLTDFHRKTAVPTVMDDLHIEKWVHHHFALALPWIRREDQQTFVKIEEKISASLLGQCIPLVWSHGDFTLHNLLYHKKKGCVSGVIDWDYSERPALPLLDLLYFLYNNEMERQKKSLAEVICERLSPAQHTDVEHQVINNYCRAVGVPSRFLPIFTILSWIYYLVYHFVHQGTAPFPDLVAWWGGNVLREMREEKRESLLTVPSAYKNKHPLSDPLVLS